jgi:S1-C subfamily serine protease
MKFKHLFAVFLVSAATFFACAWVYGKLHQRQLLALDSPEVSSVFKPAKFIQGSDVGPLTDFENAAAKAAPAVVHIKVLKRTGAQGFYPFGGFGGMSYNGDNEGTAQQVASGSGVIVSEKGYIVTNNHVVDNADELLVTLNDKNDYKAKVIGTDPSTDLAVIKIEGSNLPTLNFANSDEVRIGQWILAIGYPLNLETTVTSGIVSAKARSIGINNRNSDAPIESFIQTDAAVNPGNSGGALVNTDGDLIGINSAIASPTGSYAGYSYAIPSNLVKRVVSDIIQYGASKRGYLGIMLGSDQMSDADRQKNNIPDGNGVYVIKVADGSAASQAGIQQGDFITKINGRQINTGTELIGKISSLRPGDKVDLTYVRSGSESTTTATLQNSAGNYQQQEQDMNQ